MKRITASLLVALTTVALVSLFVPSSFAARAMSDDEMDSTTAKGQSAIDKGSGNQEINDHSDYKVEIKDYAQSELQAGNAVNAAGENNIASAVNAATTSGTLNQENNIDQNKAGTIAHAVSFSASSMTEDTCSSTKSTTYSASESKAWQFAEAFPPTTITLNPTITTTGTGNGDATTVGSTTSSSTVNNTGSYTTDGDAYSLAAAVDADIDVDIKLGHHHKNSDTVMAQTSEQGDNRGSRGQRYEIQANVQHSQDSTLTDRRNTQVDATGDDAAISQSTANSDVQAYGVGIGKTLTEVSIDLPKAKSGSGTFDSSESATCDTTYDSSHTTVCSTEASYNDSIVADTIKVGDGDQTVNDCTRFRVELRDSAQQDAVVLNLLNVAGRNNVATAWNVASETPFLSGSAAGNTVQINNIVQVN